MTTVISGGQVVSDGTVRRADVTVEHGDIVAVGTASDDDRARADEIIDASGCYVLPGVIDTHVHFRQPGLTDKGDIESESRAAAAGGVTSFFDMPNTVPQTVTPEALDEKFSMAAATSHVNYSFFYGATNDNAGTFARLDTSRIPGIKLFMGSSTGNMLVDRDESLQRVFSECSRLGLPLMAHCEDTTIINRNMSRAKEAWGDDPPVAMHPLIRSEEACIASTRKAVAMAMKHGTQLHVAHVSTAEELELFGSCPTVTAEACVGYLLFTQLDHERLGARIKVNPAIKSPVDQYMLRQSLTDGRIATVSTDHAPHLAEQKAGGCCKAASGMPMVQFSLVSMLELVDNGVLSLPRLVELMSHNPARLFGIVGRGFVRRGCRADLVIVHPQSTWTVTPDIIESKCGWSPVEGHVYQWRVERTLCNGRTVFADGCVTSGTDAAEELRFAHDNNS